MTVHVSLSDDLLYLFILSAPKLFTDTFAPLLASNEAL